MLAYTEEEEEAFTAEETQLYRPQPAPVQQIDPVVALERMCNCSAIDEAIKGIRTNFE